MAGRTAKGALLALAALCAFGAPAAWSAGKVYRWVDEDGKVHYGDAIPPEYSKRRHDVLNRSGMVVETRHQEKPKAQDASPESEQDRALLATYASVEEIELVRDRRLGYLASQNDVAEGRLDSLLARRERLRAEGGEINEVEAVDQRIAEYQAEIAARQAEQLRIGKAFETDIRRFRELKGIEAPGG